MYESHFDKNERYLPTLTCDTFEFEESIIYVYYFPSEATIKKLLQEANSRGDKTLGGGYSATKHKPHTSKGEYHLHIYSGNNQIGAINKSGTTHDAFHGSQIPKSLIPKLKRAFPGFEIPANGLLESAFKLNPNLESYSEKIDELYNDAKTYLIE
ncbi:hypothetical protein [Leptospira kmetyi]|uniref:Uncharacterized protein n=1 Tax=Leptospira kmetyi TaxID=408139 RepID=A0ABX4N4T5_9LEPT|nr:hypothetical protein [Leptospira kmetyi]PJZ28320.1 hypothetical protein CH378_18540 [Leptospira kmetyi]